MHEITIASKYKVINNVQGRYHPIHSMSSRRVLPGIDIVVSAQMSVVR